MRSIHLLDDKATHIHRVPTSFPHHNDYRYPPDLLLGTLLTVLSGKREVIVRLSRRSTARRVKNNRKSTARRMSNNVYV